MPKDDLRGRFVWYELLTTDPDAAIRFYTKILGWGTAPFEQAEGSYTMWTNQGTPVGGVMALPEEAKAQRVPPNWLGYVGTPDVDATAAQATELGGRILKEPADIPKVGRFAVIGDPQGAVIAVFTPSSDESREELPPKKGEFSWHELATTNHESAFQFYHSLFGWEKTEAMDMGPMGIYQMYGRHGKTLGGMFNKSKDMPGPPAWLYYVMVNDVHPASEKVKELGGKVLNGPMEVPGGDWITQCMDPQGAAFAIHSPAPAKK